MTTQETTPTKQAVNEAASRLEEAAGHAKERGQELIHNAAKQASEAYHSARDYAQEAAYEARERAYEAARYARRASDAGVSFLGAHALPLSVIGLGLGWLALSLRNEARLRELEHVRYVPTLRREMREPIASSLEGRVSDGTAGSTKLLGVRRIDVSPSSELGPSS